MYQYHGDVPAGVGGNGGRRVHCIAEKGHQTATRHRQEVGNGCENSEHSHVCVGACVTVMVEIQECNEYVQRHVQEWGVR